MPLNSQDIDRIAQLARLELGAAESEQMRLQINSLFELVERMRAVDTSGVAPLEHPVAAIRETRLPLADDVVREANQREANQRNAPLVERGLFLVPRVVE